MLLPKWHTKSPLVVCHSRPHTTHIRPRPRPLFKGIPSSFEVHIHTWVHFFVFWNQMLTYNLSFILSLGTVPRQTLAGCARHHPRANAGSPHTLLVPNLRQAGQGQRDTGVPIGSLTVQVSHGACGLAGNTPITKSPVTATPLSHPPNPEHFVLTPSVLVRDLPAKSSASDTREGGGPHSDHPRSRLTLPGGRDRQDSSMHRAGSVHHTEHPCHEIWPTFPVGF